MGAILLALLGRIVVTQGVRTTVQTTLKDCNYIIGAGAMLTAGDQSTIARATLHAQVFDGHAEGSTALVVDFESSRASELTRLLILGVGLSPRSFHQGVTSRLVGSGDCDLGRVIVLLAAGLQTRRIHWFARWTPSEAVLQNLKAQSITLVVKPLEAIARAALVIERSYKIWDGMVGAAA